MLLGVAKNGVGISELLRAMVQLLPGPVTADEGRLSAVIFTIHHSKKLGKMAGVRVLSGRLETRDILFNSTRKLSEKVTGLNKFEVGKFESQKTLVSGDIGYVSGLAEAGVGDILGETCISRPGFVFSVPLLTVMAVPENLADFSALAAALGELAAEDPQLDLEFLPRQRELHLKITGWIQIEILEALLAERFGLAVKFSSPTIIYKETPSRKGVGCERYWLPKPCWAVVKFEIEPLPQGSGLQYQCNVGVNDVSLKYQNEVERTVPKILKQGIKGWEVTDLKVTLVEGQEHPIHSRPGDFIIATSLAIMNGLVATGTTFLEPILDFKISASTELLGSISSDLSRLRASFGSPQIQQERFVLQGRIPAATSLDYPVSLASRSGGKAKISTTLQGFEPCLPEQAQTTPYRGISPLDRAKFILKARGAIQD